MTSLTLITLYTIRITCLITITLYTIKITPPPLYYYYIKHHQKYLPYYNYMTNHHFPYNNYIICNYIPSELPPLLQLRYVIYHQYYLSFLQLHYTPSKNLCWVQKGIWWALPPSDKASMSSMGMVIWSSFHFWFSEEG